MSPWRASIGSEGTKPPHTLCNGKHRLASWVLGATNGGGGMNSTTLGVVAGVVVFAIGGLHGVLVLTVAIVSSWVLRSACIWLFVQKERAEEREAGKQRETAGLAEQLSALKALVGRRRFAIILALLLTGFAAILAATLAAHLGGFSGFDIAGAARRAISPLAALGWLLVVLTPVGLVCWVFVQVGQETRRRQAAQQEGERERQEAAQRREAERRAEQERQAEERRRQAEQEREAERRRQQQRERAAKQFEKNAWWSVLEVSPRASADEIRRAYRSKIKLYHPDRVAGLAPEFVELAERHTQALNAAYGEATRARRASTAA
jgi:DnaJ-domain-containing protein 1